MKNAVTTLVLLLLLTSCMPNPRYGGKTASLPSTSAGEKKLLPVDDYLKLGLIIRNQLGTPYLGSSKFKPGTDCSNLTRGVFGEFKGIELGRSAQDQFANGTPVARNRLLFGDLVFFSLKKNRITHVGIYVGYGEFIHASESYGVILSRLNDKYWAHSYAGARRILTVPSP